MSGAPREQPLRQHILATIRSRPGTYRRLLCQEVGASWGTVAYHVRVLRACGEVREVRQGSKALLFPSDMPKEQALVRSASRAPEAQRVLCELKGGAPIGIQALSTHLDLSRKVTRRVLRQLEQSGAVRREAGYRGRYFIAPRTGWGVPEHASDRRREERRFDRIEC